MIIASTLAVFTISSEKNSQGKDVLPTEEFTDQGIVYVSLANSLCVVDTDGSLS